MLLPGNGHFSFLRKQMSEVINFWPLCTSKLCIVSHYCSLRTWLSIRWRYARVCDMCSTGAGWNVKIVRSVSYVDTRYNSLQLTHQMLRKGCPRANSLSVSSMNVIAIDRNYKRLWYTAFCFWSTARQVILSACFQVVKAVASSRVQDTRYVRINPRYLSSLSTWSLYIRSLHELQVASAHLLANPSGPRVVVRRASLSQRCGFRVHVRDGRQGDFAPWEYDDVSWDGHR